MTLPTTTKQPVAPAFSFAAFVQELSEQFAFKLKNSSLHAKKFDHFGLVMEPYHFQLQAHIEFDSTVGFTAVASMGSMAVGKLTADGFTVETPYKVGGPNDTTQTWGAKVSGHGCEFKLYFHQPVDAAVTA